MRRGLTVAFAVIALLGVLAPPVFAQAPAPKVTIEGFIDQTTTAEQNMSIYDTDVTRSKDSEWYGRERGRFQITGEVGKVKGVFLFEHDANFGTSSGRSYADAQEGSPTGAGAGPFGRGDGSLNTEFGRLEIVWLYTEFPLTGPGSLLPFVPVNGTLRAGFQPFENDTYKLGVLAFGNYGGLHSEIDLMPGLRFTWTYAQMDSSLTGRTDGFIRSDNFATIFSLELSPYKGLDVKPVYAYLHAGGIVSSGDHGPRQGRGGVLDSQLTGAGPTATSGGTAGFGLGAEEDRHTIGVDAKWRSGPWSVDPTIFYQFGSREIMPTVLSGKSSKSCGPAGGGGLAAGAGGAIGGVVGTQRCYSQDIDAWLFDVRAGWQNGPLTLEGLFSYISGNTAKQDLRSGRPIHYYQAVDTNAVYAYEWGAITSITLDYLTLLNYENSGLQLSDGPGYDKYGEIRLGARAKYNVTPDFLLRGVIMALMTAEDVDTHGISNGSCPGAPTFNGAAQSQGCNGGAGLLPTRVGPQSKGSDNYLGTEFNLGFEWHFAPNIALLWLYGHLFSGNALNNADSHSASNAVGSVVHSARDVDVTTAVVRYTF